MEVLLTVVLNVGLWCLVISISNIKHSFLKKGSSCFEVIKPGLNKNFGRHVIAY